MPYCALPGLVGRACWAHAYFWSPTASLDSGLVLLNLKIININSDETLLGCLFLNLATFFYCSLAILLPLDVKCEKGCYNM